MEATPINKMATDEELQAITYSGGITDAMLLIHILLDEGHLQGLQNSVTKRVSEASISVKGLLSAETLGVSGSSSPQGFVAMWFDDSMNDAWLLGFEPGIRDAGYLARRIDTKDYVGAVSDEIMAEIRRSRFVVADYTGQRNGVYFEAGFAAGLGLPIIPTCRADQFDNLHFDIKHLNTLGWETPEELAHKLCKRIRAVIGAGPTDADH
jgi:hypothetical protein